MTSDLLQLTQDLIAIPSESQFSNRSVSDFLAETLQQSGFEVEYLTYLDENGEEKVSLVGKKGEGRGGFGMFSHSDTVPGAAGWQPFTPQIEQERLIGRGSCDMKGPLAATIVAANQFGTAELKKPLYIIVTADEEMGYGGARQVVTESRLLQANWPAVGVVAEPTELIPVYAHKGGVRLNITAHGRSAHTSTDQGVSANFLIAPFLAEMAELHARFMSDEYYFDPAFNPPTIGFNMVLDDGGTKPNVTAAKTVCTVGFRTTTGDHRAEIIEMIEERARHYDLSCSWVAVDPFTTDPEAEIVRAAIQATGGTQAVTVPFGTEATLYKDYMQTVVLGPGNIAQAHTVGEWIELNQLHRAVEIYQQLITKFCL